VQTSTGRIAWSDGTYSLIESVEHISFNTETGTEVKTFAHEDSGDLYSADGVFVSHFTTHSISHVTTSNGEVWVDFDRSRLNLFGAC
jgi:hypothetical protein